MNKRIKTYLLFVSVFFLSAAIPAQTGVAGSVGGRPRATGPESVLFDKWSRNGYFDGYPERKIDVALDATRDQLAFLITRFYSGNFEDYAGDASDSGNYAACLKYLTDQKIFDINAGGHAPGGTFTKAEAAAVFAKAFKLDRPGMDFMSEHGVFINGAGGKHDAAGTMSFYETLYAIDALVAVLYAEPEKGVIYNNRPNGGATRVRYYNDLIDGIKHGGKLVFDNKKLEKSYAKCKEILGRITASEDGKPGPYELEIALHDELILTAAYMKNSAGKLQGDDIYSPYGTLINKTGVCDSYAKTFGLLLTMGGINNELVYGETGGVPHIWNLVELDGEFYHVDATWDDPSPDRTGKTSYYYFNLTDDMISRSHIWDRNAYPACDGKKYNFYLRGGVSFDNAEKALEHVTGAVGNRQSVIRIKLTGMAEERAHRFMEALSASSLTGVGAYKFFVKQDCIDIYPEYYESWEAHCNEKHH